MQNLPTADILSSCGAVFVYDNGCNHAHYFLDGKLDFFKDMQQLIDASINAMHFRTHTSCPRRPSTSKEWHRCAAGP